MFKRIVVGIDFNEPSLAALEYARTLAAAFGGDVSIIHVIQPVANEVYAYSVQIIENWERAASERLRELFPEAEGKGPRSRIEVRIGPAVEEILNFARAQQADLIVLGTHGRGAIKHLFLGSVAERVVRLAACPVLTVGPRAAGAVKAEAAPEVSAAV
jgi:nucleotide-binding universal stress UspA family protein